MACALPLNQRREDRDGQMHACARVADVGAVHQWRAVGLAGDAHCARGRLRDRLEALEAAIWTERAKALDRGVDRPRIEHLHRLVPETESFHHPGPEILGHDIGFAHETAGGFLALVGFQVDDDASLVAVEEQEEEAVEIWIVTVPQSARPAPVGRALDLDHIGAEPRQHLGAGGAGLVMGKVDDSNAFESVTHTDSPSPSIWSAPDGCRIIARGGAVSKPA